MSLSNPSKKRMRAIGHTLKPIVTIAAKGLTETIQLELQRALADHELIKVKLQLADRGQKQETIAALCQCCDAELVQNIGNVALIYRAADKPNPRLSNLLRANLTPPRG